MNVMHETLSEILEYMVCIDQFDIVNCVSAECVIRNLQFVEYEVRKKMEAKQGEGGGTQQQAEWFLGRPRRIGGGIIDPALLEWVASAASKKASIMKEQRKALEESALLRKK